MQKITHFDNFGDDDIEGTDDIDDDYGASHHDEVEDRDVR